MPVPQNRKWTIVKRKHIADFRKKHGLSKGACAEALGVSAVSLSKWMSGGDPPLENKQKQLKEAMAKFKPGRKAKKKVVKKAKTKKKASKKTKRKAKKKASRKKAPAAAEAVAAEAVRDELILRAVIKHMEAGAVVDDLPAYIRKVKAALG